MLVKLDICALSWWNWLKLRIGLRVPCRLLPLERLLQMCCVSVCVQCLSVCRFDAGVVVIAIVGHLSEHVLASIFIFLRPLRLLRWGFSLSFHLLIPSMYCTFMYLSPKRNTCAVCLHALKTVANAILVFTCHAGCCVWRDGTGILWILWLSFCHSC